MDRVFGQCEGPDPASEPTLAGVRDMIVDCFTASHGVRFGETRAILGLDDGEHAVRESVLGIVRLAYTIAGGHYEEPTLETTVRVVNMLSERSIHWGAAEDDVFQHHCAIMRTLGLLHIRYGTDG
jgi:hypothetical protein